MHEAYWGLSEPPFALTPDPEFYYMGHGHEDVLMMVHYALTRNKGAAMLTGGLGYGKTALCHKLTSLLDPVKTHTVTVVNPSLNPLQFHLEVLAELGVKCKFKDKQAVARELHNRLLEIYNQGRRVVLLIDDAHMISSNGTFDELRMLLNHQMDDQFLISLVLVGQPQLAANVAKHLELDQLIAVRERIQPLSLVETGEMVMHRLRTAGYTGDPGIFDGEAYIELHRFTKGVPRLVCHLADHALRLGKLQKARFVDGMTMHNAIEEFYGSEEQAA